LPPLCAILDKAVPEPDTRWKQGVAALW